MTALIYLWSSYKSQKDDASESALEGIMNDTGAGNHHYWPPTGRLF